MTNVFQRLIGGLGLLVALSGLQAGTAPAKADPKLKVVYGFRPGHDGDPYKLLFGNDGNIYGLAVGGPITDDCNDHHCGEIFRMTPDGVKTILYKFHGGRSDGWNPMNITRTDDGTIYGTTAAGGLTDNGAVFKLPPGGIEKLLYSFDPSIGVIPNGRLLVDDAGDLIGTARQGGICRCYTGPGTIYKITPSGQASILYAFTRGSDGCYPFPGLTLGPDGQMYGATDGCGDSNSGTIFKINSAGAFTLLHTFNGTTEGGTPSAPVTFDAAGNLYGGTNFGGNDQCGGPGCGVVYKLAPNGAYTVVYTFKGPADGQDVADSVYVDHAGNIFGTTAWGGAINQCALGTGCGTVFEITPDGRKTILHEFLGTAFHDGAFSYQGPIVDLAHDPKTLYGSTATGLKCGVGLDDGCGMIYRIKR